MNAKLVFTKKEERSPLLTTYYVLRSSWNHPSFFFLRTKEQGKPCLMTLLSSFFVLRSRITSTTPALVNVLVEGKA